MCEFVSTENIFGILFIFPAAYIGSRLVLDTTLGIRDKKSLKEGRHKPLQQGKEILPTRIKRFCNKVCWKDGQMAKSKKKSSGKKQDKASQEEKTLARRGKKGETLQKGNNAKTKTLNKRNLNKLGELTLGERVAMAEEEETEEAAVGKLKATMTKQDHSRAWGQHNTWLKKQPKEEQ